MPSLFLPRELLKQILLLPDLPSILSCRLINKEFNAVIQSSTLLQYRQAGSAAGIINKPHCNLSYTEHLEAFKGRENTWVGLKPMFTKTGKVNHTMSKSRICGLRFLAMDPPKIGQDLLLMWVWPYMNMMSL
jgi:hypothetical protein